MSEGKWTKGPWRWDWRPGDDSAPGSVYAEPFEGHAYAVAMMPRYQTKQQWEADAQLIAAAPEMYDAIDPEMLEAIAREIDGFEHSARAESLRVIARRQRAAIKKAKRETT